MMKELRIKNILTGLFASALCVGLSMALYPDSVNVASRSSGLQGCRATTTSVRFRTLTMRGPKSMVTYRRLTISANDLAFATTASNNIAASDVVQCARMSALANMTAFAFDGTCMAYQFNRKLCSCLGGEKVIYVANSSISYGPPATVPFSTAPYINTTVEGIEFRQYRLVNFFSDVFSQVLKSFDVNALNIYEDYYLFPREGGGYNAAQSVYLDLASCVTDVPCGVPVLISTTRPTYYILNECGKTIQLSPQNEGDQILVYSHPGFGCKAFPDGPTYNCNVTFTTPTTLGLGYFGYFSGADGSCDGYTLGLETSGSSNILDLCTAANGWLDPLNQPLTITLRGTAAAKTFKAGFTVTMVLASA
ncbi:uncharacterized protein LOC108665400 [Hyalella azteca]|uniref:Uncharacterized protein LOC108665400 n=1 Tax=Hyalella azteca TaxID=294128 RepID=A0A8B7N335_HYAAZ|nr:uncharacterized protein LOC108665400 [Hyalella azteca]